MIEKKEPIRTIRIHFRDGTSETYTVQKTDVNHDAFMFVTLDEDLHMVPLRNVKEIVAGKRDEED